MADMLIAKQKFIKPWLRHFAPNLTKKQFKTHIKEDCFRSSMLWQKTVPGLILRLTKEIYAAPTF